MAAEQAPMTLRVRSVRYEAATIRSYELVCPDGEPLPPFTAGAHIDLILPNGLVRNYSLCNDPTERGRYVIAVNRDAASRGGSSWIHQHLQAGDLTSVAGPRNNFPLVEDAASSLFIAGGIGVTPILAMVRRLVALGRPWSLFYAARSRDHAAFLDELEHLAAAGSGAVTLHFDDEHDGSILDVETAIRDTDASTDLYCCGPLPMLETFEKAVARRALPRWHVEYFASTEAPATDGGFEVELAQSGQVLAVEPGTTILDAIRSAGVEAPFSCGEGVCGTCQTAVLAGEPDHRDMVLTDREKAANDTMMICCSGSKSPRLVLDC